MLLVHLYALPLPPVPLIPSHGREMEREREREREEGREEEEEISRSLFSSLLILSSK